MNTPPYEALPLLTAEDILRLRSQLEKILMPYARPGETWGQALDRLFASKHAQPAPKD